jgi:hypothetical protein
VARAIVEIPHTLQRPLHYPPFGPCRSAAPPALNSRRGQASSLGSSLARDRVRRGEGNQDEGDWIGTAASACTTKRKRKRRNKRARAMALAQQSREEALFIFQFQFRRCKADLTLLTLIIMQLSLYISLLLHSIFFCIDMTFA